MDNIQWSDSRLRNYIEAEAGLSWFSDESERETERQAFRRELRRVLVPVVQSRLLEAIGVVIDPEGLTMVCFDLVDDLRYRALVRRWVLVCTEPWSYLAGWTSDEVVRSYKATAGRKRPSAKVLKEIARANQ
jgi:hypothetical protein